MFWVVTDFGWFKADGHGLRVEDSNLCAPFRNAWLPIGPVVTQPEATRLAMQTSKPGIDGTLWAVGFTAGRWWHVTREGGRYWLWESDAVTKDLDKDAVMDAVLRMPATATAMR